LRRARDRHFVRSIATRAEPRERSIKSAKSTRTCTRVDHSITFSRCADHASCKVARARSSSLEAFGEELRASIDLSSIEHAKYPPRILAREKSAPPQPRCDPVRD
jgi:hypothetical protein